MYIFFFFNDTATTEIYTLSLHDALPISIEPIAARLGVSTDALRMRLRRVDDRIARALAEGTLTGAASPQAQQALDRKSTRLNSSHANISYAVFCLKKKNNTSCTLFS